MAHKNQKEIVSVNILKMGGIEEWSDEQLSKALAEGAQIFTEQAVNQFLKDLGEELKKGNEVDIEKAKKDMAKLTKKIITNKGGHKQTVWVKTGEDKPSETAYGKGKQFTADDVHATHKENMEKHGMTEEQSHKRMAMQYRKPLAEVKAAQQEGAKTKYDPEYEGHMKKIVDNGGHVEKLGGMDDRFLISSKPITKKQTEKFRTNGVAMSLEPHQRIVDLNSKNKSQNIEAFEHVAFKQTKPKSNQNTGASAATPKQGAKMSDKKSASHEKFKQSLTKHSDSHLETMKNQEGLVPRERIAIDAELDKRKESNQEPKEHKIQPADKHQLVLKQVSSSKTMEGLSKILEKHGKGTIYHSGGDGTFIGSKQIPDKRGDMVSLKKHVIEHLTNASK